MASLLKIHKPVIYERGDKIQATVREIKSKRIIFDLGGKSEGIVEGSGLVGIREFVRSLQPGDVVDAVVANPETQSGYVLLSLAHTAQNLLWEKLSELRENKEPVSVLGKKKVGGGLMVELEGVSAFVPNSQLADPDNAESLVGKSFAAQVLSFDRANERIILREHGLASQEVQDEESAKRWSQTKEKFSVDSLVVGTVAKITPANIFVGIPDKITGVISGKNIPHNVKIIQGQEINCSIQGFDDKRQRIILSLVLTTKPVGYK